jgi:hypothetical protein
MVNEVQEVKQRFIDAKNLAREEGYKYLVFRMDVTRDGSYLWVVGYTRKVRPPTEVVDHESFSGFPYWKFYQEKEDIPEEIMSQAKVVEI